jgi:hypothetical protein
MTGYRGTAGEVYLGDGLYVSFDGWMIKLRAPRDGGDHWVGLEPRVMEEFLRYIDSIRIPDETFAPVQGSD